MKSKFNKFLTLLAVLLFSIGQVWGAINNTTVTKAGGSQKYIDVATTAASTGDEVTVANQYIAYTVNELVSSAIKGVWYTQSSSSSGSSNTDAVSIAGYRSQCSKYIGVSSSKKYTHYVTNCVSFGVLYDPRGSNRYCKITATNVDDGTDVATITNSGTVSSGTKYSVVLTGLDASKYYTVVVETTNGSDSRLYQIRLEAPAATPVCPSGLTISSKDSKIAFTEGDPIELTAALSAGNGTITYQWYKGSVAVGNEISGATTAKYEKSSCTTADAGDYFCVASKDACSDAVNASAYAVTVAADTKCFNMPAITSKPADLAHVVVTGGTLSDVSTAKSVAMNANGLKLDGNNVYLKVTLSGASITTGTKITVAWKGAGSGAGIALVNENLEEKVIDETSVATEGSVSHTFTAAEAAKYADEFIIHRNASGTGIYVNAITVEDCGPAVVKHTITLDYNDGGTTPSGSIIVADGKAATKPADPTWAHHRFAGWYNGASPYDWASTVSGDITLTAHWTQLYTITYAAGDGTATGDAPTQADKAATETFTVAANPFTVAGKDFVTWNDGANDYAPGATYTVGTDNVILTAQWTTAADKYTVHYMDEDGTTPLGADELVNVGEHPAGITATKPLCTFASWQLSGSDIALSSVSAAKDEEVTLTARWTKAYATSYDMEAYAASVGASKAGLEEELTAAGYAYTNINGIDNGHTHNYTYDGMKYKTNDGDLSFNVVAGKVVEVKTGHLPSNDAVIMNINGVADATVFEGADEDSETHKTNYFYSAVEALYRLDVLASKGTCAVKAVTIRDPFTVSFEAHGDADPSPLNGTPSVTLPDATNGTASLLGWFDAETGGNKIGDAGATYIPTANITLHAQWESVSTDARLASITLDPSTGAWSPAFDPEVVNYTYTMPYGTAAVPQITGATAVNAGGSYSIISQAAAWGETAVIRGVAASSDTKAYNITMLRAPKDGASIFKAELTSATTATYSGIYADADNSQIKLADDGANGYKFSGTSNFIKMALDGGTFATGDLLTMTYSKDPQQGELAIYENTTKIVGTSFENHTLEFTAGADGLTELFIRRTSDNNFNGWVSVVEVTRVVNPILTAITFAGEAGTINESYKTVTVTVPNATDLGSMTVVPTIVRNAPHATTPEAVITNAGAWVEGPNTYRIMDKDGDYTDYTVTITRAALSDDATLSSLTVNGQAIALADGVFDYSFELPYGTSSAPTVVATPHHGTAVATVDPCTLSGATITVVPESGVGDQKVYTLTFTISPWKEVVIWDGSYMTDVETSPDASGLAWTAVGCTGIENWAYATDEPNGKVPAYCSDNDKTYTHVNGSGKNECNIFRTGGNTKNTRYFQITVPAGYVAKFYVVYGSHGEGTELTMSIGTEASATATDGILSLTTDHRYLLSGGMSEVVGAGDYFLNATGSADFFEIRAYLRPGYGRKVSNNIGTLCVDHNVPAGNLFGATFYQIAGKNAEGKLVFEEVTSLNAGEPYVFQSTTGGITLYYGETTVANPVAIKGMIGSFTGEHVDIDDSNKTNIMYIANNKLWDCSDLVGSYLDVVANRAYIFNYAGIGAAPAHAPGKRYIVVGKDQATGFDQLEASEAPMKLIIDGQLFILRGEKMYNANGQLVK